MKSSAVLRELPRKFFHVLSLLYYLAYRLLGPTPTLVWMGAWTALVTAGEIIRLAFPSLNRRILSHASAIIRPEEKKRISGLFHTTWGTFLLFLMFGQSPRTVAFAIGCAAFGDAAAALGGKAFGRHTIGPGKTLEGSLSCLAACCLVGLLLGISWAPAVLASAAATLIEFAPTTTYFNDNLWMPLAAAFALHLATRK